MSCLIAKEEHCVGTFFHFLAEKNLRHFSPKKSLAKKINVSSFSK
jgi:hypothetical protein